MRILLSLLLLVCAATARADRAPEVHSLGANVEISAAGEVTVLSVSPRFAKLEADLRAVLGRWRFQPALLDGRPVPVQTSLWLRLTIGPGEGEALQARVELVGNGAGSEVLRPPMFPRNAMKARASASVLLEVEYDGSGAVTGARLLDSASSQRAFRNDFEHAALLAAKRWKFRPERLDGVGLAGTAVIPMKFQSNGGPLPPVLKPRPALAGHDFESGQLLTLSPTSLVRIDREG
jgi:TonB family protein